MPDLLLPIFSIRSSAEQFSFLAFITISALARLTLQPCKQRGWRTEGAVFLAEEQTAGRGRGGHSWESEQSVGIYCSVVLRPEMAPVDALFLSLMTGIAMADAIKQTTGLDPTCAGPTTACSAGASSAAF